jgi:hypothetical protein
MVALHALYESVKSADADSSYLRGRYLDPNRGQVISHREIVRANILGGDDWWQACRGGGRPRRRGGAG